MELENLFHKDVLRQFREIVWGDLITYSHLIEEVELPVNKEKKIFWLARKDKRNYLLKDHLYEKIPIVPVETEKYTHRQKVYYLVKKYRSFKIRPRKTMSFRELVDTFCPYEHSSPEHYTLLKLIAISSLTSRINVRVSTPSNFGKTAVFEALSYLYPQISIVNPRSLPALEYRLSSKVLVLDELSNLESGQTQLVQNFLLRVGDFSSKYEKSTRGNVGLGTQDTYDISKLSVVILYNHLSQYTDHSKFFDNMFPNPKAIHSRFLPLRLDGKLSMKTFAQFTLKYLQPPKLKDEEINTLKDFLRGLWYFMQSPNADYHRYSFPDFPEFLTDRHLLSYNIILHEIDRYCENEEEFNFFVNVLNDSIKSYYKMVNISPKISGLGGW